MGINVRLWPSPVIGLGKRIEITVGRKRFRDQVTEEDLSSAFTQLHITPELFLPEQTRLLQNNPNPFNPEVWILFELAKDSAVSVIIYDMAGSQVRQLVWDYTLANRYTSVDRAAYCDGTTEEGETGG